MIGRLMNIFCVIIVLITSFSCQAVDWSDVKDIFGKITKGSKMLAEETTESSSEPTEFETPTYVPHKDLIKAGNNQEVDNNDGLLTLINKYAPVIYLHPDERYFPMSAEEYFTSPEVSVKKFVGKKRIVNGKPTSRTETVIEKGKVNFQELYNLSKKEISNDNLYIDIPDRVKFGSNPTENKNEQGALTTPAYAIAFEQGDKIYLQYIFLYGFNAPYVIKNELFLGAHEADLEHFTVELDKNTKRATNIFYAAHGENEGILLSRDQMMSEGQRYLEGTHPIVYIARGGHGTYPKEGIYVRFVGMANDITQKGLRWEPKFIRVYQKNDERFDPKSMGWLYFPGTYGVRGVASIADKDWFGNGKKDIDTARRYNRTLQEVQPTICKDQKCADRVAKKKFFEILGT